MELFEGSRDRTVGPHLSWLNEPEEWAFTEDGLAVTPAKGTDFFRPYGGAARDNAPMLYATVRGDFTAVTRARAALVGFGDAAALTLRSGPTLWAKICIERSPIGDVSIVSVVTQKCSDDSNGEILAQPEALLRLTRKGNVIGMHYRIDGTPWRFVRTFALELPDEIYVGVHAQAPFENGCQTTFAKFVVTDEPVQDLRSGD